MTTKKKLARADDLIKSLDKMWSDRCGDNAVLRAEVERLRAEVGRLKRRRFDVGSMNEEPQCSAVFPGYSKHGGVCVLVAGHSGDHTDEGFESGGWSDEDAARLEKDRAERLRREAK